ncbi:hypothetical protein BDQ94DRAFT_147744 [Aspergillus welwitschiae]|uniref:Uncharacterized protein n=1 Tax=Aspergillus welwitschiae TaxID=1341132 RepID=A0A3F3PVI2_9EURO|nr:hypothetical protein BDQ94DRAFT_147744 [Aspergillus welwitschiae]RDH30934.1 hypothetical protein BDQ94DRAFT_147744 [Aspergillus welwitschiae]
MAYWTLHKDDTIHAPGKFPSLVGLLLLITVIYGMWYNLPRLTKDAHILVILGERA